MNRIRALFSIIFLACVFAFLCHLFDIFGYTLKENDHTNAQNYIIKDGLKTVYNSKDNEYKRNKGSEIKGKGVNAMDIQKSIGQKDQVKSAVKLTELIHEENRHELISDLQLNPFKAFT